MPTNANEKADITNQILSPDLLNRQTLKSGTATEMNAFASPVQGMKWFTTDTFLLYYYNGSSWTLLFPSLTTVPDKQVADLLSTTIGDYTTPSASFASSSSTTRIANDNGQNASSSNPGVNSLYAYKYTGLIPGSVITKVGVQTVVSSGNIRVKVYSDSSGAPNSLLAESNSTASAGGWVDIALTASVTVPASGILWAAVEVDNGTVTLKFTASSGAYLVTHTYGAGPASFGGAGNINNFNFRLTFKDAASAIDGNTGTEWTSSSETNPFVILDMGSALLLTSMAIYWDGVNTTSTQLLIQLSPDGITWTTVRTINTNLLVNGAWNYFRWNLPNIALCQYVRIYGNDGSNKVLAIWEVKVKQYANTSTGAFLFSNVHGHPSISSSVATTALNS